MSDIRKAEAPKQGSHGRENPTPVTTLSKTSPNPKNK